MDFQLSDEQRMIKETVYKWSVNELGPLQEKIDEEDWLPPDFFKKCAEIGILGITIDEKYGGLGGDVLMQTLAIEEMSRICPALAMTYGAHSNLCAHNIHRNASEALKEKYLPPLVRGEKIGAMALTEPDAGSDAMSIRTRALRQGDQYLLQGYQDLHHQRAGGRHLAGLCQNRAGARRQRHQRLHRRKGLSRVFRVPLAEKVRHARFTHG